MSRPSKKFVPTRWSEWLVPVLLVALIVALVGVIGFVLLTAAGIF
jgi:ABC-type Fe3+-siderophore transport system permease subunit